GEEEKEREPAAARGGPEGVPKGTGGSARPRRGRPVPRRGRLHGAGRASGSGKSTLLHLAGGLDKPDAGRILLEDRDLSTLSAGERAQLRRRQVGFVFQFFHLIPTLTVAENVELPLVLDGARTRNGRVGDLLDRVGLSHRTEHV